MKKMLALALALMLALSCVSALAELPGLEDGVTVAAAVNLDQEAVMNLAAMTGAEMDEATAAMMPIVFNIINGLGLKAAVKGTDAQIDVLLKDTSVAALNLSMNDQGIVITCDAIPTYAFTVSAETIQALLNQIMESMPADMGSIDPEALGEAIGNAIGNAINTILSKAGETEMGDFNVDGMSFNARIPVNITTKELALITMNMVKEIVAEPSMAPILSMAGDGFDLSQIEESIQELEAMDEASMPVTEAFIYGQVDDNGNANGIYVAVDISRDGETVSMRGGYVGNHILAGGSALDQGAFKVDAEIKEDGADINFTVEAQGMSILVNLVVAVRADGGADLRASLSMNGSAPIFSGYLSVVPGAEITAPASAEGKNVIAIEDLMAGSEEASGNAMTALQSAAIIIMSKAMQVMPEEFNAIMTMVNGQGQSSYGY